MRKIVWCGMIALVAVGAFAVEPDKNATKLEKEIRNLNKITAGNDGRRVANRMLADRFLVPRAQLVAERQRTGYAYGQLFLLHEIARRGETRFEQVAAEFEAGNTLSDLAANHYVDIVALTDEAKKFGKAVSREMVDESVEEIPTSVSADRYYDSLYDSTFSDMPGLPYSYPVGILNGNGAASTISTDRGGGGLVVGGSGTGRGTGGGGAGSGAGGVPRTGPGSGTGTTGSGGTGRGTGGGTGPTRGPRGTGN